MKAYYIYIQDDACVNYYFWGTENYKFECEFQWQPWYLAYIAIGTRDLYNWVHYKKLHFGWVINWTNNFEYSNEIHSYRLSKHRGIIVDEDNKIRDYDELTDRYKKKSYKRCKKGYHYKCWTNMNERKQSLTDDDKAEFDFYTPDIRPKRDVKWLNNFKITSTSRSWKDQTKRKRQYKTY